MDGFGGFQLRVEFESSELTLGCPPAQDASREPHPKASYMTIATWEGGQPKIDLMNFSVLTRIRCSHSNVYDS